MNILAVDRDGVTTTDQKRVSRQALRWSFRCVVCGGVPEHKRNFDNDTYYVECGRCKQTERFIHEAELRRGLADKTIAISAMVTQGVITRETGNRLLGIKPSTDPTEVEETKNLLF